MKASARRKHLALHAHVGGLGLGVHALDDPEHVAETFRRQNVQMHAPPDAAAHHARHDVPAERMLRLADAFDIGAAHAAASQHVEQVASKRRSDEDFQRVADGLQASRDIEAVRNEHVRAPPEDLAVERVRGSRIDAVEDEFGPFPGLEDRRVERAHVFPFALFVLERRKHVRATHQIGQHTRVLQGEIGIARHLRRDTVPFAALLLETPVQAPGAVKRQGLCRTKRKHNHGGNGKDTRGASPHRASAQLAAWNRDWS